MLSPVICSSCAARVHQEDNRTTASAATLRTTVAIPTTLAALQWGIPGPQKITFGEMRSSGVRGLLIYWLRLSLQPLDRDQRRSMA
jgi:hypothetical protein